MPVTRTATGKLPPQRVYETTTAGTSSTTTTTTTGASSSGVVQKVVVNHKATPEEIKEKMEQQLRLQRAAHHQKRALEMQKQNQSKYSFDCLLFFCVLYKKSNLYLIKNKLPHLLKRKCQKKQQVQHRINLSLPFKTHSFII